MNDVEREQDWPRTCPECGTPLEQAVIDFDEGKAHRPELRPGEMAAVDFCPNPDCPAHRQPVTPGQPGDDPTAPGSLGGDNGGG